MVKITRKLFHATYTLEPKDMEIATDILGSEHPEEKILTITLRKGYANKLIFSGLGISELDIEGNEFARNDLDEDTTEKTYLGFSMNTEDALNSLVERIPKFLYFDEYYQMKGQANIASLKKREADNALEDSEYPLLGLNSPCWS